MIRVLKSSLAFALLTVSVQQAYAADFTMRLSHQYPPNHKVSKSLDTFAEEVEKNSAGRVDVQMFGAEQLYKGNQNHPAVARGEVEAAAILSYLWGNTIPEMAVMSIPFLMTSSKQLQAFPDSEAAQFLDNKIAQKGIVNIAWLLDDNYAIFTSSKKPLVSPEDFKGLKIRGQSKLTDYALIAMGAAPSTMPGGEVYQALLTGVIDSGYTGVSAAYTRRYYEAQKFGTVGPMTTVYSNLVVNPKWWSKLPEDLQAVVKTAAKHAQVSLMPESDDMPPKAVDDLRAAGMNVTVLDAQQQKALKDAMQPPVVKAFEDTSKDAATVMALVKKL